MDETEEFEFRARAEAEHAHTQGPPAAVAAPAVAPPLAAASPSLGTGNPATAVAPSPAVAAAAAPLNAAADVVGTGIANIPHGAASGAVDLARRGGAALEDATGIKSPLAAPGAPLPDWVPKEHKLDPKTEEIVREVMDSNAGRAVRSGAIAVHKFGEEHAPSLTKEIDRELPIAQDLANIAPAGALARGAKGAVRAAGEVDSVAAKAAASRSAPLSGSGAPPAAGAAPAASTAVSRGTPTVSPAITQKAQDYVASRLGMRWDDIGPATRGKLESVAKDGDLSKLNPEAVKRQVKLEALPVPLKTTRARLERSDVEGLKEEAVARTDAGANIRDIDSGVNRDLAKNVEYLESKWRGVGASRATATTREGVGEAVAGRDKDAPGALTLGQQKAKARTKSAYELARSTEPDAKVAPDRLYEFVRGNPEVLNPQIQHLGWLNTWLKKAGIETENMENIAADALGDTGHVAAATEKRAIGAKELDDLRKKAGKMAGGTGDSAHYAKEVMGVIDQMFDEGLPASAKNWKAARAAHAAERGEYKNQGAIDRLVGSKGGAFGTDPKTALEDVYQKSFKGAKIDEIRQLKRSLIGGQDSETRLAGRKALRELKSATARDMLQTITKGVSTDEKGMPNITAASINKWLLSMGPSRQEALEKLNVMVGKRATRQLLAIEEAAQIAKTAPAVRKSGSDTFMRIVNWVDDHFSKIPIAGHGVRMVTGTLATGQKLYQAGDPARVARRAATDATSAGFKRTPPPTYQGSP